MALAKFELAEFESATAWFDVLPQKNKSTNSSLSSPADNHHAGGGGGGGGGLLGTPPGPCLGITLGQNMQGFSNHKYEFCGKTGQSSSPVQ